MFTLDQLRELIVPVLEQHGLHSAILFGSYAKGCATVNSDVDLLVDAPHLKGLKFIALLTALREVLECDVDLYDKRELASDSPLQREIKRTGVIISGT